MAGRLKRAIVSTFRVGPGEGQLLALFLLLSFCVGAARVFTMTSSNALFLTHFGADHLPYVYMSTAALIPLVGFVLLRLDRVMSLRRKFLLVLLLLALAPLLFRVVFATASPRWASLGLLIWTDVEWTLTGIVIWVTASRVFTVRQVKRLFGLIGVGEVVATMLGGLVIPSLLERMTTPDLLLFSAVAHLGGFAVMGAICRARPDQLGSHAEQGADAAGEARAADRGAFRHYTAPLFAIIAAVYFTFHIADNAFYEAAQRHITASEDLAAFFGWFFATFGLLNLLCKSLVTGPWLARFGLLGGLLSTPITVGILGVAVVVVFQLAGPVGAIFWLVCAIKLAELVTSDSLWRPAYFALYHPLPPGRRARAQSFAETVVSQIAAGFAGVFLLVLHEVFGLTEIGLTGTVIVVSAVYAAVAIAGVRRYRTAVAAALSSRELGGAELSLDDPGTLSALLAGLSSEHPREVIYCLEVLAGAEHPDLDERILGLLSHEDEAVREAAYRHVESLGPSPVAHVLAGRLEHEESERVRPALLRALAAAGETDVFEQIVPFLHDGGPEERVAAIVGLLRYGGLEGALAGGNLLQDLARSDAPEDRALAARALGEVGAANLYRSLQPLLSDDDVQVRRAALVAAGQLRNPKLWPLVIAHLDDLSLRPVAIDALQRGRESSLPALEEAYDVAEDGDRRSSIVRMFGRIRGKTATELLLDKLEEDDAELRRDVLVSLRQCGFRMPPDRQHLVTSLLRAEVAIATRLLAARLDLAEDAGGGPLELALRDEHDRGLERVFLLLSLVYPADTMSQALASHRRGGKQEQAFAVELVDTTLRREHKALVLPLLEEMTPEQRLRRLAARFPEEARRQPDRAAQIARGTAVWIPPWVHTCAVHSMKPPAQGEPESSVVARVEALRAASIFDGLPGVMLARIAERLDEITFEPDARVIVKGELGTAMFVVAEGDVRVHVGERTLAELGPGSIFGELAALSSEPRTASVTTATRCRLFRLSQDDLHGIMSERIEIARGIVDVLCQRLRDSLAREERVTQTPDPPRGRTDSLQMRAQGTAELGDVDKVLVLKTASIFADSPDAVLADLARRCTEVHLDAGHMLFAKRDLGTTLFVVVTGRVKVHDGSRIIAELGARAVFGELAALSSEPRSASVTATEDTRLLALEQSDLYELMWDRVEVVRGLMDVLVSRLRSLS